MSPLISETTESVETLPDRRQGLIYRGQSVSWLLVTWWRREPGHQQLRYLHIFPGNNLGTTRVGLICNDMSILTSFFNTNFSHACQNSFKYLQDTGKRLISNADFRLKAQQQKKNNFMSYLVAKNRSIFLKSRPILAQLCVQSKNIFWGSHEYYFIDLDRYLSNLNTLSTK